MTIDGKTATNRITSAFGKQTSNRRQAEVAILETPDPPDRFELSVNSLSMHQERRFVETPEMRARRIEDIRHRIQTGTYNIRAEEVAESILCGTVLSRKA